MEQLTADDVLTGRSAAALGLFDGVHRGHRAVLKAAAACAREQQLLPCAFTFAAASVPAKQGQALQYLYPDGQKTALIAQCGMEAMYCPSFQAVKEMDGETFCRQILVKKLHAAEVFCGGDFRFGARAAWDFDDLCRFGKTMGFGVHQVAPVRQDGEKISSTAIRQLLLAGAPEQAALLLGAPYQICGRVTHGAALGSTHAVPTINMQFAPGQLMPRYGVYVSRTYTPDGVWDSITNIGVKPTVSAAAQPGAETFLLDFSGDLYDTDCRVELLHFLRPEQQFPDVNALYRQIGQDQAECRLWLRQNAGCLE